MTPSTTSSALFAPSRSPRPDDGAIPDTGVAFALRRRSFLVGGLGLSAAGALVACGSSGGTDAAPSGFSTATGPFTGTDTATAAADAAVKGAATDPHFALEQLLLAVDRARSAGRSRARASAPTTQ